MCVICVVNDDAHRPTDSMVQAMWESNDAGGGVGYITHKEDGTPLAKWEKGIDNWKAMAEYAKELPEPFILHFRIPSVGGRTKALTHPFPLQDDVTLNLSGESENGILFHNGTWGRWKETLKEFTLHNSFKLPAGEWSDTRAMALMAHRLGPHWVEMFVDEKVVILVPQDEYGIPDLLMFGTWNYEYGMMFSNMGWVHRSCFSSDKRRLLPCTKNSRYCNCEKCCEERATRIREGGAGDYFGRGGQTAQGQAGTVQRSESPLRENGHSQSCTCILCTGADLVSRGGGSVNPPQGSRTLAEISANPTPQDVTNYYASLSKKQKKRLMKRFDNPKQRDTLTTLERRALFVYKTDQRKKLDAALKKEGLLTTTQVH